MRLPKQHKYPKQIVIGTEVYKIRFVKVIAKQGHCYGLTDPNTRTIKIKSGQTPYQTFVTYIHELIHAMEFEYDLKITHKLVYQLEESVAQFFLANF